MKFTGEKVVALFCTSVFCITLGAGLALGPGNVLGLFLLILATMGLIVGTVSSVFWVVEYREEIAEWLNENK